MPRPKPEKDFDPTRQQLEDLQALLDRMLQIPVLQAGDVPDNVLPARRPKRPSLLVPSPQVDPKHALRTTPPEPPPAPSTLPKPPAEAIVVAPATVPAPSQAAAATSEPERSLVVAAVPSAPAQLPPVVQSDSEPVQWSSIALSAPPARATVRPPRSDVAPSQSLALLPLRAINWCFDVALLPLGAPGRWLGSRAGRNVLGWTGVVLIVLAAGWGTAEATMRWIAP
jgi:hypothetical protein